VTVAFYCVLIAGLLPYLMVGIAKIGASDYNNRRPRAWSESQEGFRRRAIWAQQNSFEIFPLFTAAVLVSHLVHGPSATADGMAVAFVISRLLYGTFYVADIHWLRSTAWMVGTGLCIALFFVAGGS
jgi:uncharacterized MAPEG superfamily protein